ncbi:hypothetical protein AB0L40_19520 [Patulibacter sp. NPDC049589]|uniref:hypothetical protein n=1 Tax=Patulibacter sp. NPDC049589 TaxID=3154731 RepID=UPI003426529D
MNVPTKLAAFTAGLALTFGAATGAGALLDPTDSTAAPGHRAAEKAGGHGGSHETPAAPRGTAAALPGGLSSTQDGYTLTAERATLTAGERSTLRFRVIGPDGRPVRGGYEVEAEREMHLIVVRRDGTDFQHLHPRREPDGTWSTPLTLSAAGSHRALADFTIDGVRRTLGIDLQAPGTFTPTAAPAATDRARTDGFGVQLVSGPVRAGRETALRFQVTRDGRPVQALQPYLGARGHLVALRDGDLAYLHVHPDEHAAVGEIPFVAEFPSAGRYRLFLQFQTGGQVHTTPMTVEVTR